MSAPRKAALAELVRITVEDAKKDLLAEIHKTDSKLWKILPTLVQVVLTAVLAVGGTIATAGIQHSITDSGHRIASRFNLTEEFYKRRLSTHEQLYMKLQTLLTAVREAQVTRRQNEVNKALADLYTYYKQKGLYLSPALLAQLDSLWLLVAQSSPGIGLASEVRSKFTDIDMLIKRDLFVADLSDVPVETKKSAAPAMVPAR